MIKVVMIRNAAYSDFGGGERFPVFVAKELIGLGYEPVVVTRSPTLLGFSSNQGIQTIRGWWWSVQNWSGWRASLFPIYCLWQIGLFLWYLQLFVRLQPKIVHIQSKDDFIAGTLAARVCRARVVWTDHADLKHIWKNVSVPYKNPVGKLVYLVARFAHAITVVSNSELRAVTDNLPKKSMLRDKIQVVYNGSPDKKHDHPKKKQPRFTYGIVGRLVFDKGISEAIEAFKKIHEIYKDTELLIVGTGPDETDLKKLATNEPTIKFVGHQSDPLVFMAELDVLLQPTYHEGFSVTLVEACMMELPIIATNVGGNPEIIEDGETGLLVPARDANKLFESMKALHDNNELRRMLARNARKSYVEKYVFEDIVKKRFIKLYEQK